MTPMTPAEALRFTRALLDAHGLTHWTVVFDRAVTRGGQCRYNKREIGLSYKVMESRSADGTKNTIRHEVAHAIVGAGHHHDKIWARKYRELGGTGERCIDPTTFTKEIEGRYRGTCIKCGRVNYMHRAPKIARSCPTCNPRRYDPTCAMRYIDTKTKKVVVHA